MPRRSGMCRDTHMYDAPTLMGEDHQYEQRAVRGGRDDEEIGRHDLVDVRHVCDGRRRRLRMYFAIVASLTSIPSFNSSPWIRGAPQIGFASAMVRIRARTSGERVVDRSAGGSSRSRISGSLADARRGPSPASR